MAGHFTGKYGINFLHFGFNQGMTGLINHGPTSQFLNLINQALGAFNFYYALGTGMTAQDIPPEKNHQHITPDKIALGINHSQPISIAIYAYTQIGLMSLDFPN
jgi:hypothetical protein